MQLDTHNETTRLPPLPTGLLVGIGVAIAVTLALAGHSLWQSREYLHKEAATRAEHLLNITERYTYATIHETDLALQIAAEEYRHAVSYKQSKQSLDKFYTAYLDTLRKRMPDLVNFRAADATGLIRYGNDVDPTKPVNIADREHFKTARDSNQLTITTPIFSRIGLQQWVLPIDRRLVTADGNFGGVVYAHISVQHFNDLFSSLQPGPNGTILLFDASTSINIRYPEPKGPGSAIGLKIGSPQFKALWQQGHKSATYQARSTTDGIWRTYSYRQVGDYPLYLMVGVAEEDTLAPWNIQAAVTAAFLIVFILLVAVLSRSLRRSLQHQRLAYDALLDAKIAAESASHAKSRFLATMSHEIRTPLNGVLGMAQLLLIPGLSDEEQNEYARTILNSGHTLLALLNDILDISKVEAGKLELAHAVFDPQQVIEEITALFNVLARTKGIKIESLWRGTKGQRYWADPIRIRQMLSNLVSNAVKFSDHGVIRVEATEIEHPTQKVFLEFAVTDNGIGIPLDKQSRLFQSFSQVDDSTTRKYGGTGLGLSIVANLAQLMEGEAGVQSEPGKGSRFWFRIHVGPLNEGEESRQIERRAQ
ncbi:MAG: ATP-binding protein [Rhodocyclaceae bacterium]|nr:ATP-binding protein [Rhodocyclaceae bacterium]